MSNDHHNDPPLFWRVGDRLAVINCRHDLLGDRRPQTLRGWACLENGPLRPTRIGGLLAWSTATVKALAGVVA